jgi:chromosome segregation ATPase
LADRTLLTCLRSATNSIKEEEATSEARRIELGDAKNQLEQATTRADDLDERFRNAGTRIFELEALLAETQETLANRSTESEARGKDEALFELKEKVEQLQQTLQQTKAEHEKDVSSVEFLRAQDSREATARARQLQQRISELEQRVKQVGAELAEKELAEGYERRIAELQALPPSPTSTVPESNVEQEETKHIALMHAKIEKLRVERDDLRQKVSYLTHESRFALRAAEEDKASAMEDLQRARIDLKQKAAAHEAARTEAAGLQERLSTMTSRLESAEASFAAASTDKHDLADKVAHLELDLSRSQKERAEVDGTVALLLSRHARAELERDRARGDFSKAAKEQQRLEARIDRLQSARENAGESGDQAEDGEAIEGARSRKTSGTSSVADTEDHKQQVDDLRGRVERRDGTYRLQSPGCFWLTVVCSDNCQSAARVEEGKD